MPWRLPPGYQFQRDSPREAFAKITKWLEATANCVQAKGAGAKARVALNNDGTVDGQLDVGNIPQRYKVRALLMDVEDCWFSAVKESDVSRDYFTQGGIDIKAIEGQASVDRRYRGVNRYLTWWYRLQNFFRMMEAARNVAENVQNKRGKAYRVMFRIHWNVSDISPGRLEDKPKGEAR